MTSPTTIRAITVIPANIPKPMGKTDMFCPGRVKLLDGEAVACASAVPVVTEVSVLELDPLSELVALDEALEEEVLVLVAALVVNEPVLVDDAELVELAPVEVAVDDVAVAAGLDVLDRPITLIAAFAVASDVELELVDVLVDDEDELDDDNDPPVLRLPTLIIAPLVSTRLLLSIVNLQSLTSSTSGSPLEPVTGFNVT